MNYIGVDYHKKYSYIVVKNEDGHVGERGTVNNTKEEIQRFLEPYRPGMAVVEATRNWGLIYDWLEEVLDDVTLAHPLKVKAIAEARIKTNKISADILADLLRAGLLPRAYAPSKQTRELKNVLRQRMFFVRVQTMVKNRIYDILDRHPEMLSQAPEASDLFGTAGMQWLGACGDYMLLSTLCQHALPEVCVQKLVIFRPTPKNIFPTKIVFSLASPRQVVFYLCSTLLRGGNQ